MTVRCNCESAVCPAVKSGAHRESRCQVQVPERANRVDMLGETCDACFPHYRDAGYAWKPEPLHSERDSRGWH